MGRSGKWWSLKKYWHVCRALNEDRSTFLASWSREVLYMVDVVQVCALLWIEVLIGNLDWIVCTLGLNSVHQM